MVAKLSAPLDPTTIGNNSITPTPAVAGTVTLSADQQTLTFTPTGNFAASTPYTVLVSGFTDVSGNAVTSATSTFTTGTIAITTAPSVTSIVPVASANNVPVNTTITISINSQINPASVVTNTNSIDSLAVFASLPGNNSPYIGGTAVVTNDNTTNTCQIVFTPSNPLPPGTAITVYVVYNAYMTDFEGNRISSFSSSFTTASGTNTTPPTVTSVSPANGATGVGPYTTVALTLSKPLNPNTIGASTFALFNGATPIGTSVSHSGDNSTALLSFGNLPGNALITVEATSGATDYEGNALVPFTSSFTTAPTPTNTAPSIISQRPANGATGVPSNTTIYLVTNKTMNAATLPGAVHVSLNRIVVPGTVTLNPAGTSILFAPSAPFPAGGSVQIVVDRSATDSDGNALNGYNGSFTVLGNQTGVAPTFVAMNPPYTSDNQPLNSVVDVEFSKPIAASSVNTTNIYLSENNLTVVPASVSLLFPNVIRIIPTTRPFAAGQNYYRLDMPPNGLMDTDGNFFAGSVGTYYFYTEPTSIVDNTAPTITGLAPTNGATNIGDNAVIQVAFSKPIDPLTINGTTIHVTGGGSTVVPSTITFDTTEQIVTITPLAPLPDNTTMTIAISGVTDTSGNAVTPQSTTFTTGPGTNTTQPVVVASSVDDNDNSNVPPNSMFTVMFSAPMNTLGLQVPTNCYLYDNNAGTYYSANRSFSSDGTIAYINPTSSLPAGAYVQLGARNATDLTGNTLQGFAVNFTVSTTPDSVAPSVTQTNPGGTVNPPTNSVIQALFNKPVQATSLS